jgi:hypothetical protein
VPEIPEPFEIEYDGKPAEVREHYIKDMRVFHITFTDKRRPLVITVAEAPGGKKWWTSVPQGRQTEAEQVGKLIAAYIRAKRKEKG